VIQTHHNYSCILVIKDTTLKVATWVAKPSWWS